MKEKFENIKFKSSTLDVIQKANEIIEEYQADGFDLTLRQLYYQFVSRDLIPNSQKSYNRLGDIISNARLNGDIDWGAIKDRTRQLKENLHFDNPSDAIENIAGWYKIDTRADQDPSGIDMTRDIAERLNQTFDTPVEIKRIALNMSQIDEYNPPPNPAKLTDSRVGGYLKKYGRQSWELDALDPKTITTLIEKESNKYTDIAKRNRLISKLNEQKNLLIKCSENWEDITEYLTNN